MRSILFGSTAVWTLLALTGCEKSTVEGTAGRKLTISKPAAVTVERGTTAKVTVNFERENIPGAVTAVFSNLPDGVTVTDEGRKIEGNEATFVLEVAEDADLVSGHLAKVTIEGPEGLSASESFEVTVKDKS